MKTLGSALQTLQVQDHRNPKTRVTAEFDRPIFDTLFSGSLKYQHNRYHDIVKRLDDSWFRVRWKDFKIQKQIITDPTVDTQWKAWTDWITEANIAVGPVALYHNEDAAQICLAYLSYDPSTTLYSVKIKQSDDYTTFYHEKTVYSFTSPPYPGISYAWCRMRELVIATHYVGIPDGQLTSYPLEFRLYDSWQPSLMSMSPRYPILINDTENYAVDIVNYDGYKAFVVSSFIPMDTYNPEVTHDTKLQGFWLGMATDPNDPDYYAKNAWTWGDMTQILPTDTADQLEYQACPRISKVDDTYWLTFIHGDPAIGNRAQWTLSAMRSKDLIHWTDRQVLIAGLGEDLEPYNLAPAEIIRHENTAYLVTYDNIWTATATTGIGGDSTLDITEDVVRWNANVPDGAAGQASISVRNRGNKYTDSTILIAGADVTIEAGYNDGETDHLTPVFTGVIDTQPKTDEVGRSEFQITARDYNEKLKDWRSDRLWVIQSANRFRKDFDDETDINHFLSIGDSIWTQADSAYTASKVDKGGWNYALAGTDVFTNCTVETRMRFNAALTGYAGVLIRTSDTSLQGGYSVSLRVNETDVSLTYVSHTATTLTVSGDATAYGTAKDPRAYYVIVDGAPLAWAFLGESTYEGGNTTFVIYNANNGGANKWVNEVQPEKVTTTTAYAWNYGEVVLMKNIEGVITTKQAVSYTFHSGTWYGLKVEIRYGNIRAWVKSEWPDDSQDWVLKINYDDGDDDIIAAPGYVGLVCRVPMISATKSYDYFMVYGHETPKTVEYAVRHVATKAGILDIETDNTRYSTWGADTVGGTWMQPPAELGGHWEVVSNTLHGYTDELTGRWTLLKNTYESRDVVMTFKMKINASGDYGGVYIKAAGRYQGYLIRIGYGDTTGTVSISEFMWPVTMTTIASQDFPVSLRGYWGEYTVRIRENWITVWINGIHACTAYAPVYNGDEISLAAYSTGGAYFDDFRIVEMHEEVDVVIILPNDDGETVLQALSDVYSAHYFMQGDGSLRLGVMMPTEPTSALAHGLTQIETTQDNRDWLSHVRVIGYQDEAAGISVWSDVRDTLVEQYVGRRYIEENHPECLTEEECYRTGTEILEEHNRSTRAVRLRGRPHLELEPRDLVTYANPLDGTENAYCFVTSVGYEFAIDEGLINFDTELELETWSSNWPFFTISRFVGGGYAYRAPGTPPTFRIATDSMGGIVAAGNPTDYGLLISYPARPKRSIPGTSDYSAIPIGAVPGMGRVAVGETYEDIITVRERLDGA